MPFSPATAKLTACEGRINLNPAQASEGIVATLGLDARFLCESCGTDMTQDGEVVNAWETEELVAECLGCGHQHHLTARDANGERV